MTILNILFMSAAEIFGNMNFKSFAESNKSHNLMYGLAAYAAVIFFLIRCFGHGNMMWVTSMWEGMIIIMSSIVAYFVLGERFHHPVQYLGIVLALLAMVCVNYNPHKQ